MALVEQLVPSVREGWVERGEKGEDDWMGEVRRGVSERGSHGRMGGGVKN